MVSFKIFFHAYNILASSQDLPIHNSEHYLLIFCGTHIAGCSI